MKMISNLMEQLAQNMFLAIMSSIIPIAFANLMVWRKKIPLSLFVRFPGWRHWARSPLVIMTVSLHLLIFCIKGTSVLFMPEPKPFAILITVLGSGILITIAITLIYLMARNTFVPREEKDRRSAD